MSEPRRITSLSLPTALVARLDDEAARRDRSRSWLAGHAIETFLADALPPGGLSMPDLVPGTPAQAPPVAGGDARSGGANVLKELQMDPYEDLKRDCVDYTRRLQSRHVEQATAAQARATEEACARPQQRPDDRLEPPPGPTRRGRP